MSQCDTNRPITSFKFFFGNTKKYAVQAYTTPLRYRTKTTLDRMQCMPISD